MNPVRLLVAGDPEQYTGGYIYDARIGEALTRAGRPVETTGLEGCFPDADARAADAFDRALAERANGEAVIVDGLVLGGLPEVGIETDGSVDPVALLHGLDEVLPPGEVLLAGIAPGNARAVRMALRAGFAPIGSVQLVQPAAPSTRHPAT